MFEHLAQNVCKFRMYTSTELKDRHIPTASSQKKNELDGQRNSEIDNPPSVLLPLRDSTTTGHYVVYTIAVISQKRRVNVAVCRSLHAALIGWLVQCWSD